MSMITLSVRSLYTKALTCLEGQSAAPSLFGKKFASCSNNVSKYTSSDLVQLQMQRACTCAGKGFVVHFSNKRVHGCACGVCVGACVCVRTGVCGVWCVGVCGCVCVKVCVRCLGGGGFARGRTIKFIGP